MIVSVIAGASSQSFNPDKFRHPILTKEELMNGVCLGIDTWADTTCAGKHVYVEEFVVGKFVTATGFTSSLGSIPSLPIANVLYAYDASDGTVMILEANNSIYWGDKLEDSLLNPIQAEEQGVNVDVRPRRYYPNDPNIQCMILTDGTHLPIEYDDILPFIPLWHPTNEEIHSSRRVSLSPWYDWDPKLLHGSFSRITVSPSATIELGDLVDNLSADDPVSLELMSNHISAFITSQSLLQLLGDETYQSNLAWVGTSKSDAITPEFLSRQLHIGLPTASCTLNATTHQFIRSSGSLTRRFCTDKAQLRYKQLAKVYVL